MTLTKKGITLKEKNSSWKQKSQKGRGGTQAQSTALSHKKKAVETSSSTAQMKVSIPTSGIISQIPKKLENFMVPPYSMWNLCGDEQDMHLGGSYSIRV